MASTMFCCQVVIASLSEGVRYQHLLQASRDVQQDGLITKAAIGRHHASCGSHSGLALG